MPRADRWGTACSRGGGRVPTPNARYYVSEQAGQRLQQDDDVRLHGWSPLLFDAPCGAGEVDQLEWP